MSETHAPDRGADSDRPKSSPVKLIEHIVALLLAIFGAVATISRYMPPALDSLWMSIGTFLVAIAGWAVALLLALLVSRHRSERFLRWLIIAVITGSFLGAAVGVAFVLWYKNADDRFVVEHNGVIIVTGSEYQPEIAEVMEQRGQLSDKDLLNLLPGYQPEQIWTPSSIGARKLCLRTLFFLAIGTLVFSLVYTAYGIPALLGARRESPDRQGPWLDNQGDP